MFTPLDIDFSLRNGLHVNEDFEGTILFFHGGGFANGDIDFYTDTCMKMALKLNRRVVSVDYRRSPEYKFPAALVDCYEVARQLFARELLDDVDPEHIVLFGDSAGGNLAASGPRYLRASWENSPHERRSCSIHSSITITHSRACSIQCAKTARLHPHA